jgi:uncharacterized protein
MSDAQARSIICDLDLEARGSVEPDLEALVAARLAIPASDIAQVTLLRRSLDARHRRVRLRLRISVTLSSLPLAVRLVKQGLGSAPPAPPDVPDQDIITGLTPGTRALQHPPVIVGSGPAGLFAAWLLTRYGFRPIILERGRRVEQRVRDVRGFETGGPLSEESNVLFGEGGAGTFSDGKLTCRTRSPVRARIFEIMVECLAPEEILVQSKPHVGTDRLRAVLVHLRRRLVEAGADFRFESQVDDVLLDAEGALRGLSIAGGQGVPSEVALLGIGHSARDTYAMLHARGVALEFKPFQLGLRIEHPQGLVDRYRYGGDAGELGLPTAEYSLKTKAAGAPLYTFCMCPGGWIVPSVSQAGTLCTNGMSRQRRASGWANSGLVYTVGSEHIESPHPLAGLALQERLERRAFDLGGGDYRVPAQRASDFLSGRKSQESQLRSSYPLGHVTADLRALLPGPGVEMMRSALRGFERRWRGYAGPEGLLVGPETRGSSPVRMPRDEQSRESLSTGGLYPIGEGAGYAGGIVSAALDGIRSARQIVERYAPAGN